MELLKDKLNKYQAPAKAKRNYKSATDVEADEIAAYFGKKQCFWLYRRWRDWQILNAFKECKEKQKGWEYFMGILNKTKI